MAYIDREKFVERIKHSPAFKNLGFEGEFLQGVVLDLLNNAPTADVVEVKHGHFVRNERNIPKMKEFHEKGYALSMNTKSIFYTCSECGTWASLSQNYCSECGAKLLKVGD